MKRIGGWTRIWIALSVFFFFIAYLNASSDYRRAVSTAETGYQRTAESSEWFAVHPAEVAKAKAECAGGDQSDPLLNKLNCYRADVPNMTTAAAQRDKATATALSDAWSDGLTGGGIASLVVGVLFFAIGWVRNGFAEKRARHSPAS